MEHLSKTSIGKYQSNPKFEAQKMDNFSTLFNFLQKNLSINITDRAYIISNITQGIDSLIMINELLWSIIYHLQILPTLNKYNIGNSSFNYKERITKFLDIKNHNQFLDW